MLSLIELERAASVFSDLLVGGRIERWLEPERGRIAFSIYRGGVDDKIKCIVDLDARPEIGHVGLLPRMPKAPANLPAFAAYLRAHLSRAQLQSVGLRGDDRQLIMRFEAQAGEFVLLLSLFGRRSNLYLLDGEDRLILALRPLAETRSELELGDVYINPGGRAPEAGQDRFEEISGMPLLEAVAAHYAAEIEKQEEGGDRRRLPSA
nr:NFACT family protein [Pseudomonadota bacterium]